MHTQISQKDVEEYMEQTSQLFAAVPVTVSGQDTVLLKLHIGLDGTFVVVATSLLSRENTQVYRGKDRNLAVEKFNKYRPTS